MALEPENEMLELPVALQRLNFASTVLTGYRVEVQLKSGIVYEGIFHTAKFDHEMAEKGEHGLILKYCRVIRDPTITSDKDALAEKPSKVKRFLMADVVQVVAKEIRMNPEDLAAAPEDFETDAAISRGRGGEFGRELQRWQPDEDGPHADMLTLEGDGGLGWDQFAVNEQRFGVTSTYDEHLYTTVVDRDKCAISETDAERLAREIERGQLNAVTGLAAYHMLEERGMEIDDAELNEEDRYGAVVRDPPRAGPSHHKAASKEQLQAGKAAGEALHALLNSSTNGNAASSSAAGPAKAWGGLGAGVAAVAGKLPAGAAPPTGTAQTSLLSSKISSKNSSGSGAAVKAPPAAAVTGRLSGSGKGTAASSGLPATSPVAAAAITPQIITGFNISSGGSSHQQSPSPAGSTSPSTSGAGTTGPVSGLSWAAAAKSSQPVSLAVEDPLRKETNKVVKQLVSSALPVGRKSSMGDGGNRSGSGLGLGPGSRSPLSSSPLVGDGLKLAGLNLDMPGPNSNSLQHRQEFGKYVAQKKKQKDDEESQRRLQEFKSIRATAATSAGGIAAAMSASPAADAAAELKTTEEAAAVAPASTATKAAEPAADATTSSAAAVTTTATAAPTSDLNVPAAAPVKKSTLNPNAKAFTLSAAAKPFVPSFSTPSSGGGTAATTSTATPAVAAPAVPAVQAAPYTPGNAYAAGGQSHAAHHNHHHAAPGGKPGGYMSSAGSTSSYAGSSTGRHSLGHTHGPHSSQGAYGAGAPHAVPLHQAVQGGFHAGPAGMQHGMMEAHAGVSPGGGPHGQGGPGAHHPGPHAVPHHPQGAAAGSHPHGMPPHMQPGPDHMVNALHGQAERMRMAGMQPMAMPAASSSAGPAPGHTHMEAPGGQAGSGAPGAPQHGIPITMAQPGVGGPQLGVAVPGPGGMQYMISPAAAAAAAAAQYQGALQMAAAAGQQGVGPAGQPVPMPAGMNPAAHVLAAGQQQVMVAAQANPGMPGSRPGMPGAGPGQPQQFMLVPNVMPGVNGQMFPNGPNAMYVPIAAGGNPAAAQAAAAWNMQIASMAAAQVQAAHQAQAQAQAAQHAAHAHAQGQTGAAPMAVPNHATGGMQQVGSVGSSHGSEHMHGRGMKGGMMGGRGGGRGGRGGGGAHHMNDGPHMSHMNPHMPPGHGMNMMGHSQLVVQVTHEGPKQGAPQGHQHMENGHHMNSVGSNH